MIFVGTKSFTNRFATPLLTNTNAYDTTPCVPHLLSDWLWALLSLWLWNTPNKTRVISFMFTKYKVTIIWRWKWWRDVVLVVVVEKFLTICLPKICNMLPVFRAERREKKGFPEWQQQRQQVLLIPFHSFIDVK